MVEFLREKRKVVDGISLAFLTACVILMGNGSTYWWFINGVIGLTIQFLYWTTFLTFSIFKKN